MTRVSPGAAYRHMLRRLARTYKPRSDADRKALVAAHTKRARKAEQRLARGH
jgi:hypothetical protein